MKYIQTNEHQNVALVCSLYFIASVSLSPCVAHMVRGNMIKRKNIHVYVNVNVNVYVSAWPHFLDKRYSCILFSVAPQLSCTRSSFVVCKAVSLV